MPGPLSMNYTQQNDKESCLCGGCGCIFGEDIKMLIFLEDSVCFVLSHQWWEFLFLARGAYTQEGRGSSIPHELLAEPWAARVGETLQRAFSFLFPVSSFSSSFFFFSFLFCVFNGENCLNHVKVNRTLQQLHLQPLHRRETPGQQRWLHLYCPISSLGSSEVNSWHHVISWTYARIIFLNVAITPLPHLISTSFSRLF